MFSTTPTSQPTDLQRPNREWWSANPMAYDWHGEITDERFSPEWFDAIDARFVRGARLFATDQRPFDRIIPFERLAGAQVLEIGCGMGLHSELLARAGATVTAVDISPISVEATTTRLRQRGLEATVLEADAAMLPFADGTFDFVWSWGVIHHSYYTARAVREIARVTRRQGECRLMVYNRAGTTARIAFIRDLLLRGGFRRHSFDELLNRVADGHTARFYVPDQLVDLLRGFFVEAECDVCGQDVDVVPLPARWRAPVVALLPQAYLRRAQASRGSFLFARASNPLPERMVSG